MSTGHTRHDVLAMLRQNSVATVATAAGRMVRQRMMHYAVSDDFTVYLATMKADPKIQQILHCPSVALLVHEGMADVNQSRETEIIGQAILVQDEDERQTALAATAVASPVVAYLSSIGQTALLDCVKIVPETIKYRVFGEIVQGQPPTVLEFPHNRQVVSDWAQIKGKARAWIVELRAPFLTATIAPISVGAAMAWLATGVFHWGFFALAMLGGLFLHMGANVVNDYFDHVGGSDEINREFVRPFSGGSRMIQQGLLSPLEVLTGGLLFFLMASLVGAFLIYTHGPVIAALGLVGIVSGFFYVGRPFAWVSRGLGELLVGLNFGPLMGLGAYFVQTGRLDWAPIVATLPVGFLIAAVLYINEFPDDAADRAVGKHHLVVRLGRQRAAVGYALLMAAVYVSLLAAVASGHLPPATLLGLVTLPLAASAVRTALRHHSNVPDMIPANALTVATHLLTGLFIAAAIVWYNLRLPDASLGVLLVLAALLAYKMQRDVHVQTQALRGLRRTL